MHQFKTDSSIEFFKILLNTNSGAEIYPCQVKTLFNTFATFFPSVAMSFTTEMLKKSQKNDLLVPLALQYVAELLCCITSSVDLHAIFHDAIEKNYLFYEECCAAILDNFKYLAKLSCASCGHHYERRAKYLLALQPDFAVDVLKTVSKFHGNNLLASFTCNLIIQTCSNEEQFKRVSIFVYSSLLESLQCEE